MDLRRILREISAYERTFSKWETRGQKVIKRYTGEQVKQNAAQFNVLWANVETLLPAVFARVPQPEVTRRFKDSDPAARVAALMLERALEYEIQHYDDYRMAMTATVRDRFLPGRGIAWVRYEPRFQQTQLQISEDAEERVETIDYECAPCDYVHWRDFGHQCARSWEEVKLVWRKVSLDYDALVERFGQEVADGTPLDQSQGEVGRDDTASRQMAKATIYEVWDKEDGKVVWVSKGREEPLDEREDPLSLHDFWPCPRPLYATVTTDSLVPIPDFTVYQDQADELDLITQRIGGLVRALKVTGVYDASQLSLRRLLDEGTNGTMIPVDSWSVFSERGGIKGMVDFLPLDQVASALLGLYQARENIKAQIYEITGISDIIRGQSAASETATAQEIKGRFASLRLRRMQEDVARFAKDLLRIKAEIICAHFQPQTIALMAGVAQMQEPPEVIAQAMAILKNEDLRGFRIDITADSLTQLDDEADKQSRVEFMAATSQFLERTVAAAQAAPELLPLMSEMLLFGVRGFKVGRTVEGAFDRTLAMLNQPKPPQPNPQAEAMQAEMQFRAAQMQAGQQAEQAKLMIERERMQSQASLEQVKLQAQQAIEEMRQRNAMEIEAMRQQAETERMLQKAEIDAAIKRELALMQQQAEEQRMAMDRANTVSEVTSVVGAVSQQLQQMMDGLAAALKAPRRIVRGKDGRAVGVEANGQMMSIVRGIDGRLAALEAMEAEEHEMETDDGDR